LALKGTDAVIEAKVEGTVHEEGIDPFHQEQVEAPIQKHGLEVCPIDVVKKSRDVKQ